MSSDKISRFIYYIIFFLFLNLALRSYSFSLSVIDHDESTYILVGKTKIDYIKSEPMDDKLIKDIDSKIKGKISDLNKPKQKKERYDDVDSFIAKIVEELSDTYFDNIKLLLAEGIFPEIDICLNCNKQIKPGNYLLNLIESGIFCNDCSGRTKFSNIKLLEQEIRLLKHIKNTEYDNNTNLNNKITQKTDLNLYKKLSTYIKFYTNKELKSEKILFSSINK